MAVEDGINWRRLDASQQNEDEDNHQHQSQSAAGKVAPVLAVWPGRQSAHQEKDKYDNKDNSHGETFRLKCHAILAAASRGRSALRKQGDRKWPVLAPLGSTGRELPAVSGPRRNAEGT